MTPSRQLAFLWGGAAVLSAAAAPFAARLAAGAPACLFHAVTGVACPTCGGTRALLALARLDLAGALAWNPLVALAALVFLAGGFVALALAARGRGVPDVPPRPWLRAAAARALAATWAYVIAAGR